MDEELLRRNVRGWARSCSPFGTPPSSPGLKPSSATGLGPTQLQTNEGQQEHSGKSRSPDRAHGQQRSAKEPQKVQSPPQHSAKTARLASVQEQGASTSNNTSGGTNEGASSSTSASAARTTGGGTATTSVSHLQPNATTCSSSSAPRIASPNFPPRPPTPTPPRPVYYDEAWLRNAEEYVAWHDLVANYWRADVEAVRRSLRRREEPQTPVLHEEERQQRWSGGVAGWQRQVKEIEQRREGEKRKQMGC